MQTKHRSPRDGVVGVIVLVAMMAAVAIAMISLSRVTQQSQMRRQGATPQTSLLIESAVSLTKVRLQADPTYTGETWSIPAKEEGLPQPAEVVIAVTPHDQPQARNVDVQVTVGSEAPRISRESLRLTLTLPQPE